MYKFCETIESDPEAYIKRELPADDIEGQVAYRSAIELNILHKESGQELDGNGRCSRMAGFDMALAIWACS